MVAPVPKSLWEQFFRCQFESSYGAGGGTADWNIGGNGGGATGWRDLAVMPGSVRITPTETQIFSEYAAGLRAMNQQAPIPGAYETTGSFEMPFIPELCYPILRAVMGTVSNANTAGSAALAATAFASVATLDTQPNSTEVLEFTIASSTAASSAIINIVQNAATVESINIGTSASSVDGTYYSKGAYDGSSNAITFTVSGSVTAGTVAVAGIDYVTNTFDMGNTNPTMRIEEAGQPRSATNSSYYTGVAFKDFTLAFDRTALDGLVTLSTNFAGQFPTSAAAGTYDNDAKSYYHPLAAWTASLTKDGAAFDRLQALSLVVDGGTELFQVATGDQNPDGRSYGPQSVTGTFTILPEDATEWNNFVGQTVADYTIILTSPNNIVDSQPWTVTIELSECYLETYVETVQGNLFGADLGIRTTQDATDGIIQITNLSRMPT